jgi:hypothetical protein
MSFADAWKKAAEPEDEYEPANGTYSAKLVDAGAFTTKTSQRDKIKFTWQILAGDDVGRQFDDMNDVDASNPTGVRITREKLLLLGFPADYEPTDNIKDMEPAVRELIGVEAQIRVQNKDGWANVYVDSSRTGQSDIPSNGFEGVKTEEPEQPSFAQAAGQKADTDDVPF